MDAILELPPGLPAHDPAPLRPVPAQTIAEWPAGTFVENLCPLADGSFAIAVLSEARVDRIWPDGRRALLLQLPAPPTGLVRMGDALFINVGIPDQAPSTLWRMDLVTREAEPLFVASGAEFMNGLAALTPTMLLAAESATGRILALDLEARSTSVWLADERLTRAPQAPFLPGANGIKVFENAMTVTSNGRALVLRAPVLRDGSAGPLAVVAERLRGDDLAFDTAGACYIATHIGHSLERLDPDGVRVTLAGPDQGLAGSTACAFGVTDEDRRSLYVTTTGGIIGPVGGTLQPAKLIRLEVGAVGAPLLPGGSA